MKKKTKLFTLIVAASLITMACSCPITGLIDRFTNPQPEDLLELVPDDMMDQLPEDMGDMFEEMVTAVPDEFAESLENIPEALQEGDLEELFSMDVPENIPVAENYDELISFGGVISYTISSGVVEMTDFYDTQMLALGWTKDSTNSYVGADGQSSAGNFSNETQTATVSIVESDGQTLVTIIVSDK